MVKRMLYLIMTVAVMFVSLSLPVLGAETVASGSCGKSASWTLDSDGTVYITGTGTVSNDENNPWWGSYGDRIKHISVGEGIKHADRMAFYGLPNLETVVFAEGFQSIGMNAMSNCEKLREVSLPKSLFTVHDSAFDNDYELERLYFKGALPAGIYGYLFTSNNYKLSVYTEKAYYDSYRNSMLDYAIRNNREYVHREQGVKVFTNGFYAEADTTLFTLSAEEPEKKITITASMEGTSVEWFSADTGIASVNGDGVVTRGEKHGTTTIYAILSNGEHKGVVSAIIRNKDNSRLISVMPEAGLEASFPTSYTIRPYDELFGGNEADSPDIFSESDKNNSRYVEILEKTKEITKDCKTDYEKAKAICSWVHGYIEYGGTLAMGRTISQIYSVFKGRKSHCQGYAYVTGLMLYQCGIINATVSSKAHMWNLALIDGRWVQVDSTWGWFDREYNEADFIVNITFANGNAVYILSGEDGVKFAGLGCELEPDEKTVSFEVPSFVSNVLDCASLNAKALKNITLPAELKKITGTPFVENGREFDITFLGNEEDWMNIEFSHKSQKKATVNIGGRSVSFKERIENKPVDVVINGRIVNGDVPPQIMNGRAMVPIRVIAEYLMAEVLWDGEARCVTIKRNGNTVALKIGSKVIERNGIKMQIEASPIIINGRTLVPVRAVADALGADVSWDKEGRYAIITDFTLLGKI